MLFIIIWEYNPFNVLLLFHSLFCVFSINIMCLSWFDMFSFIKLPLSLFRCIYSFVLFSRGGQAWRNLKKIKWSIFQGGEECSFSTQRDWSLRSSGNKLAILFSLCFLQRFFKEKWLSVDVLFVSNAATETGGEISYLESYMYNLVDLGPFRHSKSADPRKGCRVKMAL